MRKPKGTLYSLPFADCVLASTLSPAEVEHPGSIADPRWCDLSEDSHLWTELLEAAFALDGAAPDGLFGALHGLRCLGARLHPTRTGARLRPGDLSRQEYLNFRGTYLVPHEAALRRLLVQLQSTMKVESFTA